MQVSLIVPVYNAGKYLEEFLDSVKAQTFTEFEAVFVDDGSTDGSGEKLDEFGEGDSRFKVIHKQNGGVVSAWKRGIAESSGKYLAFADPDDIMAPDMLKRQYDVITETGADIVVNCFNKRLPTITSKKRSANNWKLAEGLYEGEELEKIKNGFFGDREHKRQALRMFRWNKMFKRELITDNLDYTDDSISYGDDICMCAAAVYDCKKLYYLDEALYSYRMHGASITNADYTERETDNMLRLRNAVKRLTDEKGYFLSPAYTARQILWLVRKIGESKFDKKQMKAHLKELKRHSLVKEFKTGTARGYVPRGMLNAVRLLKLGLYSILISHYKI
ncbi:MAG: glycosyltransferase [Clostridiales bacterium]|nr:glycosyltransferase [Clostridiales bacterium]